jgi:hypothetical protein
MNWRINDRYWLGLFAVAAVVTIFSAAGSALHAWTPAQTHIDPPESVEDATAHAVRCPHCARIESKRELAPGMFEYTVRSSGGSRSIFEQALPTSWRVGERLMLIDGTVPENNANGS